MTDIIPLRPVHYVDRSRTTCDWQCPRKRYLQYHWGGRGVVSSETGYELVLGSVIHDAAAAIATAYLQSRPVDIDTIAKTAGRVIFDFFPDDELYANEQATLTEGLVRGFYRSVWPTLVAAYPTVVAVEREVEYTLADGVIFMSRPDLIMEDTEGEWHYLELKTTSWKKESWVNQWSTAVQLHSSLKAVEQTLGKMPMDVTVLGLYKGYVDDWGKQTSPLCYGYRKSANPPFTKEEISYSYKAGFRRTATWEMPGGVKAWVESMPLPILATQFPRTPAIFIREEMIAAFFEQRKIREFEIAQAVKVLEDQDMAPMHGQFIAAFFPQRFDQCNPSIGRSCEYRRLCFGAIEDPLQHGFEGRVPNHPQENQA